MGFFDTSKVTAVDLLKQAYTYMANQYGINGAVFQPSSPTGQILGVVANLSELIFLYLEHSAAELNIEKAQTIESVHGISRLTGHDPFRGTAASGVLQIRLNPSALSDFDGSYVKILDGTEFTIKDNGMQYFMNLGQEYIIVSQNSDPVSVEVVQGIKATQSFMGDSKKLQSYNVNTKGMTDHYRIKVFVDGIEWKRVESLYDMGYDEPCYMCKSSVNMGLTIFFGNGDFGRIPASGDSIQVEYVTHIGTQGNITDGNLKYDFITMGIDANNESVDLNQFLSVYTEKAPNMGAMYEPMTLTRMLAPHASKSFVLANPENYITFLSKYSQFSYVDAYNTKDDAYIDDDNVIYLRILPNIKDKVTKQSNGVDYFSLPTQEFVLDEQEKQSVIKVLDDSGQQLISTEVVLTDMRIKKYASVIVLKYFEKVDKNQIWSNIRAKLNTYFLNVNRTDMIPKSDIVSLIEGINGVDSVNVFFVSEENENAIKNGYYFETIEQINPNTHLHERITRRVELAEGEDPQLGLDGFGDIILKKDEVAIIKGGWSDRYGTQFDEDVTINGVCGLTVLFTSATENSAYNTIQQNALLKLFRN